MKDKIPAYNVTYPGNFIKCLSPFPDMYTDIENGDSGIMFKVGIRPLSLRSL